MNYKRLITGLCVGFLTGLSSYAQSGSPAAGLYFNQFQHFSEEKKLDSCFYYAEKLAADSPDLLNFLLHDSVAQQVNAVDLSSVDTAFASRLVRKLNTGSLPLQRAVYPLFKWVEAKHSLDDSAKIRQLVTGFMVAQDRSTEEQGNRIDRYALLLYDLLKSKAAYDVLADTLFTHTRQRLEHAVNGIYYQSVDEPMIRNPRAYFRYLMAYSSFAKANEALRKQDAAAAERYFNEAFQFSPDENDRQAKSAYFYESVLLSNGDFEDGFQSRYADFLLAKGDTAAVVQALTELTIADPGTIELLKTYYRKAPVNQLSFADYWTQTLNAKLKPAEAFTLVSLDKKTVNYSDLKGKWVLIDFWGTWCKPCVEELPRFQAFYNEFARTKQQDLVVLTVACHDQEQRVRDFMTKNNYNFPVAMVDEPFIKQFRVDGYPTKVLITPQGNRMKIPFNTNWVERVKIYRANQ